MGSETLATSPLSSENKDHLTRLIVGQLQAMGKSNDCNHEDATTTRSFIDHIQKGLRERNVSLDSMYTRSQLMLDIEQILFNLTSMMDDKMATFTLSLRKSLRTVWNTDHDTDHDNKAEVETVVRRGQLSRPSTTTTSVNSYRQSTDLGYSSDVGEYNVTSNSSSKMRPTSMVSLIWNNGQLEEAQRRRQRFQRRVEQFDSINNKRRSMPTQLGPKDEVEAMQLNILH